MRRLREIFALGAAAGALLAVATPAGAVTLVSIGLQEAGVNGNHITKVGTAGATNSSIAALAYGVFNINSVIAQASPLPDILDSTALDQISAVGSGTIHIFVTEKGITTPLGLETFKSSFTANELPPGWTLTEKTFISPLNHMFSTTNLLSSHAFDGLGSVARLASFQTGQGPYSLTEEFTLVAHGAGNGSGTIDISSVPEPATWALMLIGFGGLGASMRSRRRAMSAA